MQLPRYVGGIAAAASEEIYLSRGVINRVCLRARAALCVRKRL